MLQQGKCCTGGCIRMGGKKTQADGWPKALPSLIRGAFEGSTYDSRMRGGQEAR